MVMRDIVVPTKRTDGTTTWLAACVAQASDDPTFKSCHFRAVPGIPYRRAAMEQEYKILIKNKIWKLVPHILGANIIDCPSIFKVNRFAYEYIEQYKARLVVNKFRQKYYLDYKDTFSPAVKPTTIQLLLSLVVNRRCVLCQLEIQNSFLNWVLYEEVYMQQPPDFEDPVINYID